jgi:drug/metabolite transporter (DMT)-like permease
VSPKRRAYAAWVVVCLVWGTTYLGIRVALETIPPLLMGGIRWILAGALIAGFLKVRGERLPSAGSWIPLALLGFLLIGLGNGGVVWAEQTVASGLTAMLVATSPFWMVGVDATWKDGEPLTARRIGGLIVGFAGILLLVGPELRFDPAPGFLAGVMAAQIACAGWAVGSAYARRRRPEENVLAAAALEMLFAGLFMLIAGTLRREWSALSFTPRTAGAFLYLVSVGSIGGFCAYLYALKHLPVSFVSLYAYINPVIAVILGVWLLKEPFKWRMAIAGGIVLAGVALVRRDS